MSEQQAVHSTGQSEAVPSRRSSGVRLPADISDAFDHLFAIGLASILEAELDRSIRLSWHSRREVLIDAGPDITGEHIGQIMHKHALRHADAEWLTTVAKLAGGNRSPLSPRIGKLADQKAFRDRERVRRPLIDGLLAHDWLTRRFLGALGRPVDWAVNDQKEIVPDRGASAWEMKTRNRGEEFVQNRLKKLAQAVAARDDHAVTRGLLGVSVLDESGKNTLDSRTGTGLHAPRPTDSARAWAALWGISAFPVQPVTGQSEPTRQSSTTAGALRLSGGKVWFFIPVAEEPQTVAALRAVIRSGALARQALVAVRASASASRSATSRDFDWLEEHGIRQFVLFDRAKSDNAKAPELYALPGRTVQTARIPPVTVPRLQSGSRQGGKSRGSRTVSQGVI